MSAGVDGLEPAPGPKLPPGRNVDLPGRGTTFVRELPGRNLIRVSCGYWTSETDLERLLGGLA